MDNNDQGEGAKDAPAIGRQGKLMNWCNNLRKVSAGKGKTIRYVYFFDLNQELLLKF